MGVTVGGRGVLVIVVGVRVGVRVAVAVRVALGVGVMGVPDETIVGGTMLVGTNVEGPTVGVILGIASPVHEAKNSAIIKTKYRLISCSPRARLIHAL